MMRSRPWIVAAGVLLALGLTGCGASRPYVAPDARSWVRTLPPPASMQAFRVFLIGNAGDLEGDALAPPGTLPPTLRLLKAQADTAGPNSAVVFLGDNLYPAGLPDSLAPERPLAERRLLALLHGVEDVPGRIVFIPGNRDWNAARRGGLAAVARQERFVEEYLDRGNVFLPDNGFPGPLELKLTDDLRMIVLDTQWWLTDEDKSFGETDEYEVNEPGDVLLQLDDLLREHRNRNVLVVGHHPIRSNGRHGGYFPPRAHVFPLTSRWRYAYLPLPVIGSLYPLYRRYVGYPQDLANARYASLRQALDRIFDQHEALVYAAAHDRNLQYFADGEQHYLVSGSGSGSRYVERGRGATFAYAEEGYQVLQYYTDGSAWLEVWTPTGDGRTGQLVFRTRVLAPLADAVNPNVPATENVPDFRDSTVVTVANPAYRAGPLKRALLGSQRREAWATPVEVPVFDLGTTAGGLTPVRRGGSAQTLSIRLQNEDGKEFVLRTVDKSFHSTQEALKGTFAAQLLQDQISQIHPYAALLAAPLADSAGLYHANPRLVYVPYDPRFGIYADDVANQLMLFEERPDEDMSDAPTFGGAENVIGATRLYQELNADNDHRVDARLFARARLFDMWIADWDRHEDQWRWAAFEPHELNPSLKGDARTEGKIYRPVPRDRDWAFFQLDGLIAPFVKYFLREYQDFDTSYGDLRGLTLKGRAQDRRFLASLSRSDWLGIADSLQATLTDDVIEAVVHTWPDPIVALNGEETIAVLKARRDRLPRVAEAVYRFHARVVDVVGSNKHERFEVTRLNDDSTRIVVHKTTKEGEYRRVLYERTFLTRETEEIRLFGLDGHDRFLVTGEVRKGPRVIIVGGSGPDDFEAHSLVRGPRKKTHLYDTATGNTWSLGPEVRRTTSTDPAVNEYDPYDYKPDLVQPLTFFGSNKDDGFFLGGGVHITRHGFRKRPYAQYHRIAANASTKTFAANVRYDGWFTDLIGTRDARLEADLIVPGSFRNFYGLGNETENTERDARYYQAELTHARVRPAFVHRVPPGLTLQVGPFMEFTDVRLDESRFVGQPQAGLSPNTFEEQWFTGLNLALSINHVDDPLNPRQGYRWHTTADAFLGLQAATDSYTQVESNLAFYVSPSLSPQVTLAARVGGAHNAGAFPFYNANTLGGRMNVRGYRSTRFAGRSSAYTNLELRAKLFDFATYLAVGEAGALSFFDTGRVWTDGERSDRWHKGAGGGLWVTAFDTVLLTATIARSAEERTFSFGFGFQY